MLVDYSVPDILKRALFVQSHWIFFYKRRKTNLIIYIQEPHKNMRLKG